MTTVRAAVRELPRFPDLGSLNVSQVAGFMAMGPPISIRDLLGRIDRLPPSMTLTQPVVTGAALGGTVALTIDRNGAYTFSGSMRATGFPSFQYTVTASVRSDAGVAVAARHTGRVYGTDTPGDRQDSWSQTGTDADLAKLLRNTWPLTSHGTLSVTYSEDLAGTLGTAVDILKDLAEFVVGAATLGASVACCLLIGSELHHAGINLPGLGGIVGLTIVAGSVYVYGPFAVVPAVIAGAAAGAVVDSMVRIRSLDTGDTAPHGDETGFARAVFGDSLDFDRIRVTNLSGLGTRAFTTPTVDGTILLNIGNAYDSPTTAVDPPHGYATEGQILIHELTHAWQIQHASLADGYIPGLLCQGIYNQGVTGRAAYQYGPPGPAWSTFNLEAQAAIVDQWFAGTTSKQPPPPMDTAGPYYGYIRNNIRASSP
jgi:hypothetical protein